LVGVLNKYWNFVLSKGLSATSILYSWLSYRMYW